MDKASGGPQDEEYMSAVGVSHEELTKMKKEKINLQVNDWEERRWRTEVEERETLEIYRAKSKIGEEGLYLNDSGSMTLFRCRNNTIKLNWCQRFQGGAVDCRCDCVSQVRKKHRYFLKECRGLQVLEASGRSMG